jgi:hypothetical protein
MFGFLLRVGIGWTPRTEHVLAMKAAAKIGKLKGRIGRYVRRRRRDACRCPILAVSRTVAASV